MNRAHNLNLIFAICISLLFPSIGIAQGHLKAYVQPNGAPAAPGRTFEEDVNSMPWLHSIVTEDFDDATFFPPGATVPEITYMDGDVSMTIDTDGVDGMPYVFRSTVYFAYPNAVDYQALVMGSTTATISISSDSAQVGGVSFWIFDDGSARDSAYFIQATNRRGRTVETVLESSADRINGYQMEGFVGFTSRAGLQSISITPFNPETGEFWSDIFEIDSLSVVLIERNQPNQTINISMPQTDDDEVVEDDEDESDEVDDLPPARRCRGWSRDYSNDRRNHRWYRRYRNRIDESRARRSDGRERRCRRRNRD